MCAESLRGRQLRGFVVTWRPAAVRSCECRSRLARRATAERRRGRHGPARVRLSRWAARGRAAVSSHVAAVAGRADAAALAGECHHESRAARHADRAGEAEAEEPAGEIAAEFVLDVSRHGPLGRFPPLEPALEVLRHDLVERRLLGPTPLVTARRRGASVPAASAERGKPCDRGDHGRTGRWTAGVNSRTLSAGPGGSPPAVSQGSNLDGCTPGNPQGGAARRLRISW